MSRTTRRLCLAALTALTVRADAASAAPPLFERFREYRIVDASGRVAPRVETDAAGRVVARPTYAPPPVLLRGRPFYLGGYAGARYDRDRNGPVRALTPTGYYAGAPRKPCGHVGACRHDAGR